MLFHGPGMYAAIELLLKNMGVGKALTIITRRVTVKKVNGLPYHVFWHAVLPGEMRGGSSMCGKGPILLIGSTLFNDAGR